ncbi:MAG: CHASE2 domain-containing protein [Pseudomonadota bacterium]
MIGRRPTRQRIEQLVLGIGLTLLVIAAIRFDWLSRWDLVVYDAELRLLAGDPPSDVVIVSIDEQSLSQVGRWPWSRDVHAKLITRLSGAGAKAIGFDILFAEPNERDPVGDAELGAAIATAPVILPVAVEAPEAGELMVEIPPFPALAEVAAGLAHVHVELDADGIARGVYLRAGIGNPYWPNFGLALYEIARGERLDSLPGIRSKAPPPRSAPSKNWVRDHRVLIPFVGPPGSFARLSYADALAGNFPDGFLRDKVVLIGMTAAGLDQIPTPVSGHASFMPGVEFNANVFHALRENSTISPMHRALHYALSIALVIITLLIYPRSRPLMAVVMSFSLAMVAVLVSALVLVTTKTWFPPLAAVLGIIASYPLWSWRRLDSALNYLRDELERLRKEQEASAVPDIPNVERAVEYMTAVLPDYEWSVRRESIEADSSSIIEAHDRDAVPTGEWRRFDQGRWTSAYVDDAQYVIGVQHPNRAAASWESELLDDFVQSLSDNSAPMPSSRVELLETHIRQVQHARDQLRDMRSLVDDSLAQMADGVIVVSELGQIISANRQAARYLLGSPNISLAERPILPLLESLRSERREIDWAAAIREVMSSGNAVRRDAQHSEGTDLLVQLAPLRRSEVASRFGTLIINIADVTMLKEAERRRAELMSFLSHDLRSPLVSILALVELSEGRDEADGLRQLISQSGMYAERSLSLLEQFLELTRAESSERLRLHENDLVTLSLNAYEQTWAQASAKGIDFRYQFEVDEAWIWGDAELIERAIVNLLNNAIKYSDSGSSVRLTVGVGESKRLFCRVSDTGAGIAEDDVGKLFERFERLSEYRGKQRGSGLGLTFVKAVVDRHQGAIEVDSTQGEGSRFTLLFPAHDMNEAPLDHAAD